MGEVLKNVLKALRSHDAANVMQGIGDAANMLKIGVRPEEKLLLMEAIGSLFYVDSFDRPDLVPAVDQAIKTLSTIGDEAIPFLVEQLSFSDLKAGINLGRTLGRMGKDAIPHLVDFFHSQENPYAQSMALYALSKVNDPEVLSCFDDVLKAFSAENQEVRDTAARTIGKFFEHFDREHFTAEQVEKAFTGLSKLLADHDAPVRSKAIRSLGKMVGVGVLDEEQKQQVETACRRILGELDFEWDRAYIVRMEAEDVLKELF